MRWHPYHYKDRKKKKRPAIYKPSMLLIDSRMPIRKKNWYTYWAVVAQCNKVEWGKRAPYIRRYK